MPNNYIKVHNQSGKQQSYVVFAETPLVDAKIQPVLRQIVFASLPIAPKNITFGTAISPQYFAICGVFSDKPADHVRVMSSGMANASLCTKNPDGTQISGSTLNFHVVGGLPLFTSDIPQSPSVNTFQVNTDGSFTSKDALQKHHILGIAGSIGGMICPIAVFTPDPNMTYQIGPTNTYCVAVGNYPTGSIIDVNKVHTKVWIDFSTSDQVSILHDQDGNLMIQD